MSRKVILLILVAAAGCSREPQQAQPLAPQPAPLSSFSGVWETEYRVLS